MGRFRITVDVLPSLDSLVPLARRAVREEVAVGREAEDGGLFEFG